MKYCPQCQKPFTEAWLSFCSDDGTPLIQELTPPADPNWDPKIRESTVQTPDEPSTQWLPREPPAPGGWIAPDERPPMDPRVWQPPPPPSPYVPVGQRSEALALASMITGIGGLLLVGCFGPFPGMVALALGLVAKSQIKKSPEKYAGKGFATAGVITGSISVAFYIILLLFWLLAAGLGRIH
jgi:hypothetical protein